MPEKDLTLKFKVTDDGSVVLDKISSNIQKIDKSVSSMNTSLGGIKAASIVYLGEQALQAANKVYDFSRAIASVGNDIQRMSRTFNMTTTEFQKWSYVTKMVDVDIEGFGQGFKFLTRSMGEALQGTGDAAYAFKVLGINLKDSTGRTKDQQTVMMEVIGTLEKYADGVNRDNLMLAIFGRGWMSIKPLVDQGTKAIEDNRQEAERLNLILGKDFIKTLSESEDAYKKWEAVWKASKIEFWTPMVKTFTDLLEKILELKTALREGGFKGLWEQINKNEMEAMEKQNWQFYGGASERVKGWVAGWTPSKPGEKPEAPGGDRGVWDLYGMTRTQYEAAKAQLEANAEFQTEWIKVLPDLPVYDSIIKDLEKMANENEILYEYGKAINKLWQEGEEYLPLDKLKEMDVELAKMAASSSTWKQMGGYEMFGYEVLDAVPGKLKQMEEEIKKSDKFVETFAENLSSAWSTNLSNMLKGTETFSEGVKNIFTGMGDAFINVITKMITNWLMFGSITGEKGGTSFLGTSKGGYGGLIGGLASLFSLGEGGITSGLFSNYPIHSYQGGGIARSPQIGIFGEAGQEAFVPLKGGKIPVEGGGGGNTYITYIEATDVDSFARRYGSVIESVYYKGKRFNRMSMRQ